VGIKRKKVDCHCFFFPPFYFAKKKLIWKMEKRKRGKESVLNNQSVNNQQVPVEQKTLFQKGLLRDEHWSKVLIH